MKLDRPGRRHFTTDRAGRYDVFSHLEYACGIPSALYAVSTYKENGLPNLKCRLHATTAPHSTDGPRAATAPHDADGLHRITDPERTGRDRDGRRRVGARRDGQQYARGLDGKYGEDGFALYIHGPKNLLTGQDHTCAVAACQILRKDG